MTKFMFAAVVCAALLSAVSNLSAGDDFMDVVHRRLSSADPAVRMIGLRDAASLDEDKAVAVLKEFIPCESNPDVLCEAARLCGQLRSAELVPTLEGILKRGVTIDRIPGT